MTSMVVLTPNSRIAHRQDCPSLRGHYVDGHHVTRNSDVPDDIWWYDYRLTEDALRASGRHYRRCETCAPDVPEPARPARRTRDTITKVAKHLCHSDVGRESVHGHVTEIRSSSDSVVVYVTSGEAFTLHPEERFEFRLRGKY